MSNKKKPRKLRTPNLPATPAAKAPTTPPAPARAGGQELVSPARLSRPGPVAAATANFDYPYVKKDLRRIGILAGSFIVVLVALSFFIR